MRYWAFAASDETVRLRRLAASNPATSAKPVPPIRGALPAAECSLRNRVRVVAASRRPRIWRRAPVTSHHRFWAIITTRK